jgi:hypothetical protein
MAKFKVFVEDVYVSVIEVDSLDVTTESDAREYAEAVLCYGQYPNGDELPEPIYDRTIESSKWVVWAEDQ